MVSAPEEWSVRFYLIVIDLIEVSTREKRVTREDKAKSTESVERERDFGGGGGELCCC